MQELTNAQFISLLRHRNIDVHVKDARLVINAPAGAVDAPLRAELTRRKSDLLAALQSASARPFFSPLVPAKRTQRIPQTHAQQGLWLIDHFQPGHVAYNIPEAFIVEGSIDLRAFQSAVDQLLFRHETLRTSFYEEDGDLFQAITPDLHAAVESTDLSNIAENDRDQALHALIREQARRPFDLAQAPLVRFHIFRMSERQSVVFFNIHHIIADRRSLTILGEELSTLYQAAVRKETADLPALPIQYADYAIWAENLLADGEIEKQLMYWKNKLAALPDYLELQGSLVCPEQRTSWGATTPVVIPAALRDSLSTLARQERATLFMTLLAAFAVFLYRRSGKEDFCIGSPITYRKHVETEALIGLFVNMIVLRCELAGNPSFRNVVRRMRNTALEAYENSDVPFQELVRALKPDPRSMRSPFFQIMFGFDSDVGRGPGTFVQMDTKPGTARFDLTLQLTENTSGIFGSFEYCTDLFDEATMAEFAKDFVALLQKACADPDQSISNLQIPAVIVKKTPEPDTLPSSAPNFWKGKMRRLAHRFSHRS